MTENEFRTCITIFVNVFKNKTIGEIVSNSLYHIIRKDSISKLKIDYLSRVHCDGFNVFCYRNYGPSYIELLIYDSKNIKFYSIKEFLKYFEIYFEDIV